MNATPETFKPGERWLFEQYRMLSETVCVEWSSSRNAVLVYYPNSKHPQKQWRKPEDMGEMYERLPDVESGNHKTESPRRFEADSGITVYSRGRLFAAFPSAFCEEVEALIEEWAKKQSGQALR